mmetsp:Transcript_34504/g.64346  ORF Transcript_34504/g.64346 Transcript_34504/m.64346 type:complete len:94 (-) Transcript_34504:229-510(-)
MSLNRVHRVLQYVVYLASWASMLVCFVHGNPGPYFFITTLETHISAPAPLGQFIPILDVTTNFFPVHAWLLAPASLLLFLARAMRWRDWQANY